MQNKIRELTSKLGVEVNDVELYIQAVTHTSYAHEHKNSDIYHNERLEFLGDAVLELLISEILFFRYPKLPEGELTKLRAALVCEETLFQIACRLDLGSYLRLGKGEEASGGRERQSILSDAVEAVLGALYLDLGFKKTKEITFDLMHDMFEKIDRDQYTTDYKTTLQEITQRKYDTCPAYSIIEESGPDHDKEFLAEVVVDGKIVARGKGKSKKEAEQMAARTAWEKIK